MIRIVIAEDQEMLLGTIGSLLDLEEDFEVVGRAYNGAEALTLIHELHPDVVIMDIEMPGMSGLEAAQALKTFKSKVIILTTFARAGNFHDAVKADVRGYLLKDSPSEELINSVRKILAGERIYSPELMDEEGYNQSGIYNVEELIESESSKHPSALRGTVKNYLTTILDKMKLPTG
jgi:two-component system, NarL family, response regulator DesR